MMDINDILIHLGEEREKYFNAVSPPIIQSSNFVFDSIEHFRSSIQNELANHLYTRGNNPTVEILRKKIAALENTEDALITGSGASAVAIAVMANLNQGDHALIVNHPYSWTHKLFTQILNRFGVEYSFVDGTDLAKIKAGIKGNTKLLYLESPNSVTFELQDLRACAQIARQNNIITLIDNSYASPLYQKPHDLGIDLVIHSGTKYINGHSDVVCGMICGTKEMIQKIFKYEYMTFGTIISPNDAAMIIRGLRTLSIRMDRIRKTTDQVLEYLRSNSKVRKIYFPFEEDNPQLVLAKQQMSACTGLFSIILNVDTKEELLKFVGSLKRFLIAVSWGGHESLMMPFISFHDVPGMDDHFIDWRLIRFSIGLEDAEYLIDDFKNAFASI